MKHNRETLEKFIEYLIFAIIVIFIYKTFDISLFTALYSAFFPIIIGAILAYFLQPLVYGLEKLIIKCNNEMVRKYNHAISSIIVFVIFMMILIALAILIIPSCINYIVDISGNMSTYLDEFKTTIQNNIHNDFIAKELIVLEEGLVKSLSSIETVNPMGIFETISQTGSKIISVLIGLIFTPYCLIEATRLVTIFDRICLLFISKERLDLIHDYAFRSNQIFGRYIYGKFLDSLIIGIIAFIGLGILKIKYFPLLAAIILITNMIPYFGPFIGGVPAVLVALITGDIFSALSTALFILALQQFDGLFLGPKILGDVVGISPFWVLLSITVFGSLFGFVGMFLGVPIICIIRMFFHDVVDYRQKTKKME